MRLLSLLLFLVCLSAFPGFTQAQVGARAALAKEIKFTGVDDPTATLEQVLDLLNRAHKLSITVNEAAFKAEQVTDVLKTRIADRRPVPPDETQAYYVLKQLISTIPSPSGATLVVRGDKIEITTVDAVRKEKGARSEVPPPPGPLAQQRTRQAQAFLKGPIEFDVGDDRKTTLEDVLRLLEKKHSLRFDVNDRAFRFDMVLDVLKTPVTQAKLFPPVKNVSGAQVLGQVLERIPVPSKGVYILRPSGCIEITTGAFRKMEAGGK